MTILNSRAATAANERTNAAGRSEKDKIWQSESSVTMECADILSFAFADVERYDGDKPVSYVNELQHAND